MDRQARRLELLNIDCTTTKGLYCIYHCFEQKFWPSPRRDDAAIHGYYRKTISSSTYLACPLKSYAMPVSRWSSHPWNALKTSMGRTKKGIGGSNCRVRTETHVRLLIMCAPSCGCARQNTVWSMLQKFIAV